MASPPNAGFAKAPNGSFVPLRDGTSFSFYFNAANAGQQVTNGAGLLKGLAVAKGVASATVSIYDGTGTNGTLIGTFDASAPNEWQLGINIVTGIFVVVTGAPNVLVRYA